MARLTARKGMDVGTTDPEEQALVRAICAEPLDDLRRLVFADWLEEHGETERSSFIRVQCELAKCRPDCGPGRICRYIGESTCIDLRKRNHELLEYFATEDMAQRFGLLPHETLYTVDSGYTVPGAGIELRFSRGFVSCIECTLRDFMGGECGRCRGRGRLWVRGYENRATPIVQADEFASCRYCTGTGRTPGLVDTIFRVQPIEQVTISDSEPHQRSELGWRVGGSHSTPRTGHLPIELFSLMPVTRFSGWEAAIAALSRACVTLGRSRAGLPPI